MHQFAVWVRPMGSHYLVSVEGLENANWLLTQLSRDFIFRNAEPITQDSDSAHCTFHVPYDGRLPVHHFRRVLAAIPEVRLAPEVQVQHALA